jgi:hypothetical protein
MVDSFELALTMAEKGIGPLTTEATGAIVQTAFQLATTAAAHDAFLRAEAEAARILEESFGMSCESPPTGCECAGCSNARAWDKKEREGGER